MGAVRVRVRPMLEAFFSKYAEFGCRSLLNDTLEDIRESRRVGRFNPAVTTLRKIMQRLLTLPPETLIHPGHREPSTVREEWEDNPFVRVWRGVDPKGGEPCRVAGEEATLILFGPDYDGTHKAWVRYTDGRDSIVGGSQVERHHDE